MWAERPPLSCRSFLVVGRSHKPRRITMGCMGMVEKGDLGGTGQLNEMSTRKSDNSF